MNPVLELAKPFPSNFVHDDGRGNSYVPHHIVTQRLIQIFGSPPKIEILRELYDAEKLTGVVMRLTVAGFDPVEEAGEADNPQSKTNGARAKDACSDAIKRCAMRLGLGLHLWAQKDYFLHDVLKRDLGEEADSARPSASSPEPSKAGSVREAEPSAPPALPPSAAAPPSSPSKGGEPAHSQSTGNEGNTAPNGATAKSLGEADNEADSNTVLTQAPSGSPSLTEPDDLLSLASWDVIKPIARSAVLQGITEGLTTNGLVPSKVEELAELDPAILDDIARRLKKKEAVS